MIIALTTIMVILWSVCGLNVGVDWDDLVRALPLKNLEETPCVAGVCLLK